jgi:hypothetical protein
MPVTVPSPGEVRFAPVVDNAYRVEITDPAGFLAQAGFVTGDLVVGLDGNVCASIEEVNQVFRVGRKKAEIRISVLRGGEVLILPMNPSEYFDRSKRGGTFTKVHHD